MSTFFIAFVFIVVGIPLVTAGALVLAARSRASRRSEAFVSQGGRASTAAKAAMTIGYILACMGVGVLVATGIGQMLFGGGDPH